MDQLVIALTIYSRPGCHLCDAMKAVVDRVAQSTGAPVAIEAIDISTDPDLESRYGLEIPVLMVNGKKAAKYRISEQDLMRIVRDKSRGSDGSGG
jgi:thiol-disulfide isomerase/thioredoxin